MDPDMKELSRTTSLGAKAKNHLLMVLSMMETSLMAYFTVKADTGRQMVLNT
jgi:hypothetical protein